MQNQSKIIEALQQPQAYPEKSSVVEIIQTHISYVFLTEKFVYKIKKAVNFGFLDFSTLEKRRFYCETELEINRRLCDDMYLQVVPIKMSGDKISVGGMGETVEYALKMKRMPQDRIMSKLLEENKVDEQLIDEIAKIITDFHAKAETNSAISQFGSIATIKTNWDENFDQTRNVIGTTISAVDFDLIYQQIGSFLTTKKPLLQKRVAEGKIRDCHGDIHSENIFITDRIYIFDAIEFNERFRYCDVASDMAFLAMDLDFKGKTDLSTIFVKKYIEYSGDEELLKLLPFYKSYRAYVRGKVVGFKLADPNVSETDKQICAAQAKAYFKLAAKYVQRL
jgi:uncharacterized protein